MKYPTIRIEGSILSADILDKIQQGNLLGQKPKDFWLEGTGKVKDEIVKAWADAQDMWRIYQRKIESIPDSKTGTTETRNFWMVPLLSLLGYDVQLYRTAQIINNKSYAISHNASNLDNFPIHIMGFNDSLDKKRVDSGPRMSPHALMQEYINLNEHLFAIVSNGLSIRLLRDSSRLIKLSFLEFDLERMFNEDHFSDFAIMFRLLHASRMPAKQGEGSESLIEGYHQDSLDSGSRIREGLSNAVEHSIESIANGFLAHPANDELRQTIIEGNISATEYYQHQLKFIYRLLFLMVIEERDLIFEKETPKEKRDIYYKYYSVNRIRNLSEKRYLAEAKYSDLWISLKNTFRLFETEFFGEKLEIKPLAGDLFGSNAIGILKNCDLNNKILLECLKNLSVFTNPSTGQIMRVNYGSLNVEEFGSVYEGLLEYDPHLESLGNKITFSFIKGTGRSSSGSHYTPDELVQPLIKHSLDYIIEDKLKEPDPEKALLSITVCDVACGSGHILLNAARRIANHLAKVRTGEDQPSPSAFRQAVRDVIQHCIYGVDKNPLAVELAKVALWLEAHNPGEPLNFLDHHIKCGDAIVGLAHKEELQNGIPDEAFKKLPGDDKDICKELRDRNKIERKYAKDLKRHYDVMVNQGIADITNIFHDLDQLPEHTPLQIEAKRKKYKEITTGTSYWNLKLLADIMTAQFFIPKTEANQRKIITDAQYRNYLRGEQMIGEAVGQAEAETTKNRFFHWFLEFPEVFNEGGFDCILGNPPFLGGQKISTHMGQLYLNYIHSCYVPAKGTCDLVAYFFRRIFSIIKQNGFQALVSTNTIAQGDTREGGLSAIDNNDGIINFAIRNMKWPGLAAVEVSLIAIHKGELEKKFVLDFKAVKQITTYLDDSEYLGEPYHLKQNINKSFIGSYVLGMGFVLSPEKAKQLIARKSKNKEVLFPFMNGQDLNNNIDQNPSRWVINFFNWEEDFCKENYPDCFEIIEQDVKSERKKLNPNKSSTNKKRNEFWWQYGADSKNLYRTIKPLKRVMVINNHTKIHKFSFLTSNIVFSHALTVLSFDKYYEYCLLNSSIAEDWAWKNGSTMGSSTLRYTPSECFQTFPFPQNQSPEMEPKLGGIGEEYHEFLRRLMQRLQLGLTKTYNQFHNAQLTSEIVSSELSIRKELEKKFGKDTVYLWNHLQKTPNSCSMEEAIEDIIKLRQLHKAMDEAVLEAYGWNDTNSVILSPSTSLRTGLTEGTTPPINLAHDFYEVDYLPENDRVRYTISPEARKVVLKRLLLLNHAIYEEEEKQGLHKKGKSKKKAEQPKFMRKSIDLTKTKPKPKLENKHQIEMFADIVEPESITTANEDGLLTSFHVGQHVIHDTFGEGEVLHIAGSGESAKLTVKFGREMKKLVAGYAKFRGV